MFRGFLKQSTAVTVKWGPFLDSADGNTVEPSLTISQADVRLSKNGGNIAQKSETTSLAYDELGLYDCMLNATDTNTLGILTVAIHEGGALYVIGTYMVMPGSWFDVNVLGLAHPYGTLTGVSGAAVTGWSGLVATSNFYAGSMLLPLSGTGAGQRPSKISANTGASPPVLTLDPAFVATVSTDTVCMIIPAPASPVTSLPGVDVKQINSATLTGDGDATPWDAA